MLWSMHRIVSAPILKGTNSGVGVERTDLYGTKDGDVSILLSRYHVVDISYVTMALISLLTYLIDYFLFLFCLLVSFISVFVWFCVGRDCCGFLPWRGRAGFINFWAG